jgi:hypothetical protein
MWGLRIVYRCVVRRLHDKIIPISLRYKLNNFFCDSNNYQLLILLIGNTKYKPMTNKVYLSTISNKKKCFDGSFKIQEL